MSGGVTGSKTGIAPPGAYQTSNSNWIDGFWVCFDRNGKYHRGTYIGGLNTDWLFALRLTPDAATLYAAGSTRSGGLATPGAFQESFGGIEDAWIARFDTLWLTYYGGMYEDEFRALTLSPDAKKIYAAGNTWSNLPMSGGAGQTVPGGLAYVVLTEFRIGKRRQRPRPSPTPGPPCPNPQSRRYTHRTLRRVAWTGVANRTTRHPRDTAAHSTGASAAD